LRWSREGGIDRAGITTVGRLGATCRVESGEGMGGRRTSGAVDACVERAGLNVRARLTAVRPFEALTAFFFAFRVGLGRVRFALRLTGRTRRAAGRPELVRALARTLPVVFLLDDAAFNCFPLFGLWLRLEQKAQEAPGPAHRPGIVTEGPEANPTFFVGRIQ